MNRRPLQFLFRLSLLTALIFGFQNCSRLSLSSSQATSPSTNYSGNGTPYEGKVLVSVDTCVDKTPFLKIKVESYDSALLIKNECAILPLPEKIKPIDLDLSKLKYRDHDLKLEDPPVNKIGFVQRSVAYSHQTAVSVTSQPFSSPVGAGNLLICSVLYNSPNGTAHVVDAKDNLGNVFKSATPPFGGARAKPSAGYTPEVWFAENVNGGTGHQVTFTFSQAMNANQTTRCYEYSGIQKANSLDQVHYTYASNADGSVQLGPLSTNWSNSLVLVAYWGSTQAPSLPNFTLREGPEDGLLDIFATSILDSFYLSVPNQPDMAMTVLTFRGAD